MYKKVCLASISSSTTVSRGGDWTFWSALFIIILFLPYLILSVAGLLASPAVIIAALFKLEYIWVLGILVVAYYLTLPLLFLPGLKRLRFKIFTPRSRSPTPAEYSRLYSSWSNVLSRVSGYYSVSLHKYHLRISTNAGINASAGCGRSVLATAGALKSLPQPYLEALLAHELGHHSKLHPIRAAISTWALFPLSCIYALMALVINWIDSILTKSCNNIFAAMLRSFLFVPFILLNSIRIISERIAIILAFFHRHSEYQADLTAVQLGYGSELIQALSIIDHDIKSSFAGASLVQSVRSKHPDIEKRVMRINKFLLLNNNA